MWLSRIGFIASKVVSPCVAPPARTCQSESVGLTYPTSSRDRFGEATRRSEGILRVTMMRWAAPPSRNPETKQIDLSINRRRQGLKRSYTTVVFAHANPNGEASERASGRQGVINAVPNKPRASKGSSSRFRRFVAYLQARLRTRAGPSLTRLRGHGRRHIITYSLHLYVQQSRRDLSPTANSGLLCSSSSPTRHRGPPLPETTSLYHRRRHAVHRIEVV